MSDTNARRLGLTLGLFLLAGSSVIQMASAELPAEPIPNVATISPDYPESLLFAQDTNFDAIIAGRVVLVDVATDNHNYKGALDAAQFATFAESRRRSELYVAETFYSRGTRGTRTDVLTIYDKGSLAPIDELVLPGGKRGLFVSERYAMQLIDDDHILLVYNFTPAASVTLVDIDRREILNEINIPGCGLVYPSGKRGFASLCSNGSIHAVQFDKAGKVTSEKKLPSFFDVDDDPLFDKPVYIGGIAWFPSFKGDIQALDLSGDTPQVGVRWSLLSKAERRQNWRPGGWQIASVDDAGLIYVLMHKDGKGGSHKDGGEEVWVFEHAKKQRVQRIKLKTWGISIEATRGPAPYLGVVNAEMQLDVYDAKSGKWLKQIGNVGGTPLSLYARR